MKGFIVIRDGSFFMVVAHNLTAYNTQRQFNLIDGSRSKSAEKLSSGFRINRAADDAAGLAISEKMRRQIRGLTQGTFNVQDGISALQVAEGALAEVHDMLHRLNELSVKSANDTLQETDREYIQMEVDNIVAEIDRVGETTDFNGRKLLGDIQGTAPEYTSLSDIIHCSSVGTGKMSEAYYTDGYYHPAATLDFSGINSSNINMLDGKGFSFVCPRGCGETFKFTFDTTSDDSSRTGSSTLGGGGIHSYQVGIKSCTNGADIINNMWNALNTYKLIGQHIGTNDIQVAHDNMLVKTGANSFAIYGIAEKYSTAARAQNWYKSVAGTSQGDVDCSELTGDEILNDDRNLWIQTGTETGHGMFITINRVNGETIGIRNLNVSTQENAGASIDRVKGAIKYINTERSSLGAQQNRLEHTYKNLMNVVENTQAAESLIRDTDMAAEMVRYSLNNILAQAGQSMMSQANQANQGVLSLLQ